MVSNVICFIGLNVSRDLVCSIHSKDSFYNLTYNTSHVPSKYLYSAVHCLTHRAFSFTTCNDNSLNIELNKILESGIRCGLNKHKIESIFGVHRSKKSNDCVNSTVISTDCDEKVFVNLPFINKSLASKATSIFRPLNVNVAFKCPLSLYSRLRVHEAVISGRHAQANVVYQFRCSSCDDCYIGMSTCPLDIRASEHAHSSSPLFQVHSNNCDSPILFENFSVIAKGKG